MNVPIGPAEAKVRRQHHETRNWPLTRNDQRRAPDGYVHECAVCFGPWPCAVVRALDELRAAVEALA